MTRPSRRSLLCGTASILALSAGCLADDPGSAADGSDGGNGGNDPDGNESPNDDESGGGEDLPDGLASYDSQSFHHSNYSSSPDASLLLAADDASDWLAEREPQEPLTGFVDETDFETSVLVALEAGAPNPCHELALEGIDVDAGEESEDDDELVLDAAVRDTSDEGCTTQVVTVGRLVRATFDSERLTRVSATIVDSDGQEHGFGIASESASGSASRSTSADGGNESTTDDS